ncbi:MAG: alpha/beta hydrolase fold protein [Mycobacterium sp.]|jgi:pimeloyl-ACP methyl ester carboxylesterase|nr:alpha/beta hydrolase fold protein [Mycobacterium sp.]
MTATAALAPDRERDADDPPGLESVVLHGHRRVFLRRGSGPAVLLLHGIGSTLHTWDPVIDALAADHTVIAPDLLGHGGSAKPRGDYSLGGFACGARDLLSHLGIDRVTVVGHSLGGGIAGQFAYVFPERCERLVLVASGGLGREVNFLLRSLTLPLAELTLPVTTPLFDTGPVRLGLRTAGRALAALGATSAADVDEMLTVGMGLHDLGARRAFLRTLRSVVDVRGQVVSMLDRIYLAEAMPLLVLWGEQDTVIPVEHAWRLRDALPAARVATLAGAGHFPHREDPAWFLAQLRAFLSDTQPAPFDPQVWRELLRRGRPASAAALADRVEASMPG